VKNQAMPRIFVKSGERRIRERRKEERTVSIIRRRDLEVVSNRLCRFWRPLVHIRSRPESRFCESRVQHAQFTT
jgi:hypothetical protein